MNDWEDLEFGTYEVWICGGSDPVEIQVRIVLELMEE